MKKIILTISLILISVLHTQAQENTGIKEEGKKTKEKIFVKLKKNANIDIYVDGKKFDFPIDLLDESKIKSVSVIKGDEAVKKYNSKNGVILIETKKDLKLVEIDNFNLKVNSEDEKQPIIIINGKKSNQKELKKLSTKDIESISVLKGESALKKYNSPNGVIIVKTKK